MIEHLDDGAEINDEFFSFKVKDAVLSAFELITAGDNEYGFAFASSKMVNVLVAVRIGNVIDIKFEKPFGEIYGISKYHFPPPKITNSGFGQYQFHLTVDNIRPDGFRIISSFVREEKTTTSRLPFFFGFRVYGSESKEAQEPIWRNLLASSIRYYQESKNNLSILHTSFALESFIDVLLKEKMRNSLLPEDYTEHLLRVSEKRDKLQALNEMYLKGKFSRSQIKKLYEELNTVIFSKRNRLTHGREIGEYITQNDAIIAIRKALNFIWDFDNRSRKDLLIVMGEEGFEWMADTELLENCKSELIHSN